jgi:hypothetical protein
MITLEYFDGDQWVKVGEFGSEWAAWCSLNGDDYNYRTVDNMGNVLTDRSKK